MIWELNLEDTTMMRWIFHHHSIAVGLAAAILVTCAATPSLAQGAGDASSSGIATPDPGLLSAVRAPVRSVTPSRLRGRERRELDAADLERRRPEMSDTAVRADIRAALDTAGLACGVQAFRRVGTTPDAQSIYEAACDAGPGYILVNGEEPRATSCLVLAGGASSALRRDPAARVGAQCTLPENQNGLRVIGGWAREAGVTCRVDKAEWIGTSDAGKDVYEVGCAGSEGYWMEQAVSGWSLKGCLAVRAEGLRCRFTEPGA